MVGDWSLSGRDLDRMRLRWEDFLALKFPCATEPRLAPLYDELIEWDGAVGECMRVLLAGRRVNLQKMREECAIRSLIDAHKGDGCCEELLAMERYYDALISLLDDALRLAVRH